MNNSQHPHKPFTKRSLLNKFLSGKRIQQISAKDLYPQSDRYQLIDLRTKAEFATSHIAGAINIPLHRFSPDHPAIINSNLPFVCICLSAHRSTPAARTLIEHGYEALELKGGMIRWWLASLPTESGDH